MQSGATYTGTQNWSAGRLGIGLEGSTVSQTKGYISNVRLTVGQALYTTSFKPSTVPLTTTSQGATSSNVKVLCCNNSSVTGGTAGTITPSAYGDGGGSASGPAASTNSPFDDPEGFQFGEEGDQNIIKCGEYVGNGNSNGPEVYLGWEPQWVLIKASDRAAEWSIVDCIRGIVSGGNDAALYPSESDSEVTSNDIIEVSATGFRLKTTSQLWNQDTKHYVYMAIRRPDGYVGKPPEAGTDAFAMDTGANTSSIPQFDSNFPVGFGLVRATSSSDSWRAIARLTQGYAVETDDSSAQFAGAVYYNFDSNVGMVSGSSWTSAYQGWMWKRGAGFDVVTYTGNGTGGRQIPHNLSKTPEMMWVKRRDGGSDWMVYHKNLNSGTTPYNWFLKLNSNIIESENSNRFGGAPSSVQFTVGTDGDTNQNNAEYLAMLFASVNGISKVGIYDGTGSSQTITTGFQPRLLIIKEANGTGPWYILDTLRGWGVGDDQYMKLNDSNAQTNYNFGQPTSTGFIIDGGGANGINGPTNKIIYYAHA